MTESKSDDVQYTFRKIQSADEKSQRSSDKDYIRQLEEDMQAWLLNQKMGSRNLMNSRLDTLDRCTDDEDEYPLLHKYRQMYILFTYARIFVIPSIMVPSDTASTVREDRSIQLFMTLLNQPKLIDDNTGFESDIIRSLGEEMMDFLDDISEKYHIYKIHLRSLVKSTLSCMAYFCCIFHDYHFFWKYTHEIYFLKRYMCDIDTELWAAVILSTLQNNGEFLDILVKYLNNESKNKERVSDNQIIVYKAALLNVQNNVERWTLTNLDYRLMNNMRGSDTRKRWWKLDMGSHIINIFDKVHKEGILINMKKDSPLSDDQKISINCLSMSLQFGSIYGPSCQILLSLLEDVYPYITKNITATRIAEIILYKACDDYLYDDDTTHITCMKYWHTDNISEETRLASSVVICLTWQYSDGTSNNDDMVTYLSHIINNIDIRGTNTYLGFKRYELQRAVITVLDSQIKRCLSIGVTTDDTQSMKTLHSLLRQCHDIISQDSKKYDLRKNIPSLLVAVITQFNDRYYDDIFAKIKMNQSMNDNDKLLTNCVTLTISVIGQYANIMKDIFPQIGGILINYLAYLSDNTITITNNVAVRVSQICLYSLCDLVDYDNIGIPDNAWIILWRYFTNINNNEYIKISSAYSLMCLSKRGSFDGASIEDMSRVFDYVNGIVGDTERNGSGKYLGFTLSQIKATLSTYGRTPLDYAIMECDDNNEYAEILRVAEKNEPLRDTENTFQYFISAIISGNIDDVKRYYHSDYITKRDDKNGRTALHYACMNDNIDIVRYLLDNGSDIECEDSRNKYRPIHCAALYGHISIVNELINRGCTVNVYDGYGRTPLDYAIKKCGDNSECAEILRVAENSPEIERQMKRAIVSLNNKKEILLGQGAFGRVIRCTDDDIGFNFAVKKITRYRDVFNDQQFAYIENEIKIYNKLEEHDRIVKYYGTHRDNDAIYIFMECMEGGSIADYLDEHGAITPDKIAHYTKQVLHGLDFLHRHSIIHRDIKGANILRDAQEDIKLCDFGISRYLENMTSQNTMEKAKTECGTPYWMAPEVINGDDYRFPADIWSLGATVVEMVTGTHPYPRLGTTQAMLKIANTSKLEYDTPESMTPILQSFIDQMLVPDPMERASIDALLASDFIRDAS